MADPNAFLSDPRRRNLGILAIAAAIAVGACRLSALAQASLVAPKYTSARLLPRSGRAPSRDRAHPYRLEENGAFDVAFKPRRAGSCRPNRLSGRFRGGAHDHRRHGRAADHRAANQARRLAALSRSRRPDRDGNGGWNRTEITLLDEKGNVLASMIAGKTKDIGEPGGATGLFVRKPDSNQSWLVRSVFTPSADPKDWMNKDVIGHRPRAHPGGRCRPADGPSYTVRRDKPSDADFTLEHAQGPRTGLSDARRTASPPPSSASPSTMWRRPTTLDFSGRRPARHQDLRRADRDGRYPQTGHGLLGPAVGRGHPAQASPQGGPRDQQGRRGWAFKTARLQGRPVHDHAATAC